MTGKVIIVDDNANNIQLLGAILRHAGHDVTSVSNGKDALAIIKEQKFDLMLLDVQMPDMDGFEVCTNIKTNGQLSDLPVIFITALNDTESICQGFDVGGIDYIIKPFEVQEVIARVSTHIKLAHANKNLKDQAIYLENEVKKRTDELLKSQDITVISLASVAEMRDNDTGQHIVRTQKYVHALGLYLIQSSKFSDKLTPEVVELISKSAALHDIGKVGIPDSILLKPGKLTNEEFHEMKKHALYGHNALQNAAIIHGTNSFLKYAIEIAYTHHEKWNGTGYPQGLRGYDIPISGQMMAIADVYDALVSKRVYKAAFSHNKAVEIISSEVDNQFSPTMVEAFLEVNREFERITTEIKDI